MLQLSRSRQQQDTKQIVWSATRYKLQLVEPDHDMQAHQHTPVPFTWSIASLVPARHVQPMTLLNDPLLVGGGGTPAACC